IEAITGKGIDNVLDQVFAGMHENFKPEKAKGQAATAQFDISLPDAVHHYTMAVSEGACEWRRGPAEAARVRVAMTLPNYLRLVIGELDGMRAIFTGRMKVSGELLLAQSMRGWFTGD
ncbi:MAG: SCP2 sterol-binding domain-containing protein, partial [Acidimicrobiales bacterium]